MKSNHYEIVKRLVEQGKSYKQAHAIAKALRRPTGTDVPVKEGISTPRVIDEAIVNARKEHKCSRCGQTIGAGGPYKRVQKVVKHVDGNQHFCAAKLCERCES